MKTENYYAKAIDLLCEDIANKLTDDEFIELLKSIHGDEKYKTFVLWDVLNGAQQRIDITWSRDNERIYQIYEALELEKANERGGNNEN